jgi:hypothetical protein
MENSINLNALRSLLKSRRQSFRQRSASNYGVVQYGRYDSVLILSRLRTFVQPRNRSLSRGNVLVVSAIVLAYHWSGFPHCHASPLLFLPMIFSLLGAVDTARCMRKRWDFYHAGVLLLLYADLMTVAMLTFLCLYPYALWMSKP